MQIVLPVIVRISDREAKLRALFDTGSVFTLMSHRVLKKYFGDVKTKKLVIPREGVLLNGQKITIDSFVDAQIMIKNYMIEERIYLSPDIPEEVEKEGKRVRLPQLIIGAPTMETWDIQIDIKKGDILIRGMPLIL